MKTNQNNQNQILFTLLLLASVCHSQVCSQENTTTPSPSCNNNGYCLGTIIPGCACKQGYVGVDCADYLIGTCVPQQVMPDKSDLETEIELEMNGGVLNITVLAVLENDESVDDENFAMWTSIFFSNDEAELCGYPESLDWEKTINGDCREVYTHSDSFAQTSNCFDLECYDSNDVQVLGCDRDLCVDPPCRKVYKALMTVERSYEKTNGRLNEIDSSSTENELLVEYPWIEAITLGGDSPFGIDIVTPALVENNVLLLSADYEIIEDSWTIVLRSSVLYPWRLEAESLLTFGGMNATISECEVGADDCIQTIEIITDGCDTFATDVDLPASGLIYACNAISDSDCPNPNVLDAELSVIVGATTSCTASLTIAPFTLTFETYDPDYTTPRSSFIAGSENQNINFKITAVEGSDQDEISQVTMLSLESTYDSRDILSDTPSPVIVDTLACPDAQDICFSVRANSVIVGGLEDDTAAVEDIIFTAVVEVQYANGKKRTLKRSLQETDQVSTDATIIFMPIENNNAEDAVAPESDIQEEGSSSTILSSLVIFLITILIQ